MSNGFSLFARKGKSGTITYHVRFKDSEGRIVLTLSTGTDNFQEAQCKASELELSGVVPNRINPIALEYFDEF